MHLEKISQVLSKKAEIHKPVLTVKPDHKETSGKSHGDTGEYHKGSRNRFKLKVKDQENDNKR